VISGMINVDRGKCYQSSQRLGETNDTYQDLEDSGYYKFKTEFNNCFIIHCISLTLSTDNDLSHKTTSGSQTNL
jgi:hypothetical protein